ncbi:MAG: hypothetical protein ACRD8Z_08440 [Nitrososphaeraceae archaeon]
MIIASTVLASTGFTGDDFTGSRTDRPAINPEFDPDESCLLDVYQKHCIPGSQQECPEGFANNEDSTCFPKGDCPEGYHKEDDDETGQCYPDSEGCSSNAMILLECENGEGKTCRVLYLICDQAEHRGEDYCIEFCEENPDSMGCRSKE